MSGCVQNGSQCSKNAVTFHVQEFTLEGHSAAVRE